MIGNLCIFTVFVAQLVFIANNVWCAKNNIHIIFENNTNNNNNIENSISMVNLNVNVDDEVVTTLLNLEILIPLIIFVILLLLIILAFFVLCNTERSNAVVNVIESVKSIPKTLTERSNAVVNFIESIKNIPQTLENILTFIISFKQFFIESFGNRRIFFWKKKKINNETEIKDNIETTIKEEINNQSLVL